MFKENWGVHHEKADKKKDSLVKVAPSWKSRYKGKIIIPDGK
jgi:hypothetical protein